MFLSELTNKNIERDLIVRVARNSVGISTGSNLCKILNVKVGQRTRQTCFYFARVVLAEETIYIKGYKEFLS